MNILVASVNPVESLHIKKQKKAFTHLNVQKSSVHIKGKDSSSKIMVSLKVLVMYDGKDDWTHHMVHLLYFGYCAKRL